MPADPGVYIPLIVIGSLLVVGKFIKFARYLIYKVFIVAFVVLLVITLIQAAQGENGSSAATLKHNRHTVAPTQSLPGVLLTATEDFIKKKLLG